MFNFAAAVSERIRNFRTTKVETFVPEVKDDFQAKGGGDKTLWYGTTDQPPTSEKGFISVDSPGGGVQLMRGDTGQGVKIADQATCAVSVSRDEFHRDERCSVTDEHNEHGVKPPLVRGPHLRRLLPLRTKLCPRRIGKVHPLDGSLSTQQSSSSANDSADSTQFPALSTSASIFMNGGQHAVDKSCRQTSTNKERVSSVSTARVETTLPSIDEEQTALTTNGRSRKPWTERLRTFLLPRRQQKTTSVLSTNNTPQESTDTPLKSLDDQTDSGTGNQSTLVSKQTRSGGAEHKELRPVPPKKAKGGKGQATRRPMRCIGVVSGSEPPTATPASVASSAHVTVTSLDIPSQSEKPKPVQGFAKYDDEIHTVASSVPDVLSSSFTAASKQLPPVRGIAKTDNEHLPAICLKSDVLSQSVTFSSSKKHDKKCQDLGHIAQSSSALNYEPLTSLLPPINITKHNSSSKSKKQKTKRVRKERSQTEEENKDAVAMVIQSSDPASSIKTKSSDDETKDQEALQRRLPAICLISDVLSQSVASLSLKTNVRKCQDFSNLSPATNTKEQEALQECLPAICLRSDAFSQSVASLSSKTNERKCQDFGNLSLTTNTKEQKASQERLPAICLKSDVLSSKCQDIGHLVTPCSPALNNDSLNSILPSIVIPKHNSSSKSRKQKTKRVRNDRLQTEEKNNDAIANVKQNANGPSSSTKTKSSDDGIKEQETSQDPVVEKKNRITLQEQKNALKLDVNYVHTNKHMQWDWLNVMESCLERAEELHNERINGAKNTPMTPVEIAEEIYKNAALASEKLDQLFELKEADLEPDSEMLPTLVKKSPAKSNRSKAKKSRDKRHAKSTKKERTAAQESAGRSSGASDNNKHSVDVTAGKCNQEDSGAALEPQCVHSAQQKVLPPIVPGYFQRPSNCSLTGETHIDTSTYSKSAKLTHSLRVKKALPDISSYPTLEAADLEYVVSWNGSKVILGKGSTANVFLMRRRSDGTLLAVKKMKNDCVRLTYDESMLNEVTALRDVGHSPFIPKLLGIIDYSSFALELIGTGSKHSMQDFIRAKFSSKNPLSCLEWLHVCRDVTAGLMALHLAGWLHNDLHSGNVVVCRNPPGSQVAWTGKVIDLGCAQRIDNPLPPCVLTTEEKEEAHRNASQVAPEVIEGLTGFTIKSDTYSLGMVFESTVSHDCSLSSVRMIGLSCASRDPAKRPQLKSVYKKLKALCRKKMAEEKRSPSP